MNPMSRASVTSFVVLCVLSLASRVAGAGKYERLCDQARQAIKGKSPDRAVRQINAARLHVSRYPHLNTKAVQRELGALEAASYIGQASAALDGTFCSRYTAKKVFGKVTQVMRSAGIGLAAVLPEAGITKKVYRNMRRRARYEPRDDLKVFYSDLKEAEQAWSDARRSGYNKHDVRMASYKVHSVESAVDLLKGENGLPKTGQARLAHLQRNIAWQEGRSYLARAASDLKKGDVEAAILDLNIAQSRYQRAGRTLPKRAHQLMRTVNAVQPGVFSGVGDGPVLRSIGDPL